MGETGIFTSSSNQMLSSMSGLINILTVIAIIAGALFFLTSMANTMRGQQLDLVEIFQSLVISGMIIGLGVIGPNMVLKLVDPNSQSTVAEKKVEEEKELSGEEKLKKLNAYRKISHKDILLADASVADQYLNYLKGKNLDEAALKY